ncbi:MAG: hypothetical protein Kow00121_67420 [Elainellaceae cyanobacterium]
MQAKKISGSRPLSSLASRAMKVVGVVITLSALLDIIILSIPFQLASRDWQIDFVTQFVDRGIVPLIGIVLFLTGYWLDSQIEAVGNQKKAWQDPRFWSLILASILGALFLILFPLHLNNVRLAYQDSTQGITQEATGAETQLSSEIDAEIQSQRQQINLLVGATDEQLNQLVETGRLSQEQAEVIRQFKADPNAIEPFLQERREELATQAQTQLGVSREQAQQQLKTNALKAGLRVGVSSLLLSIGFIIIGWLGLRNFRQF